MAGKRDFTDRFLRSLKPAPAGKRVIHMDAVVPGFGIRVSDKSTKEHIGAFVLVARFPGSSNPVPRRIGDFPSMTLADARQIARVWRELIAKGIDPRVKQDEERQAAERRRADTFRAAFDAYADERLGRLRSGDEVKKAIERYAMPRWSSSPIRDIRGADVKELNREVHKTYPAAAKQLLVLLKTFFSWAAEEELIEASPAAAVKPLADNVRRDRVLADWEIRAFWRASEHLGAFGRSFQFMLATGQRRTEVGSMRWGEVDQAAKLWILPRERTKADRAHEVPLNDVALSILDECPHVSDYVFASGRAGRDGGAAALAGWSKAKAALDDLMLKEAQKLAQERGEEPPKEIAAWRLHDLRRTCATYLGKLGTDRVVIGKILNHAEQGVTSIYDRHRYDDAKRRALDLWSQRLIEIVEGRDGGNVVSITAAR